MFVNQPVGYSGVAPTPAPAATGGSQAKKPGFFEKMKDTFSNMGFALGFGPAAADIKQAFKRLDNNKDKSLDTNEFGVVGNAFLQGTAAFGAADKNSNAKISLGEFKSWIRGGVLNEFKQVDANGDRFIDANEFVAVQQRNPGLPMSGVDKNNDQHVSFREYFQFRASLFRR